MADKIDYNKIFQSNFNSDLNYLDSEAFNEDASMAFGGGGLLKGSAKYGKDALSLYKRIKALKKANPNRSWKSLYKQWNKMNVGNKGAPIIGKRAVNAAVTGSAIAGANAVMSGPEQVSNDELLDIYMNKSPDKLGRTGQRYVQEPAWTPGDIDAGMNGGSKAPMGPPRPTQSAFTGGGPSVAYMEAPTQQNYATVDPLNLFGNRNGVNPFASNGEPITRDRFNGGRAPNLDGLNYDVF